MRKPRPGSPPSNSTSWPSGPAAAARTCSPGSGPTPAGSIPIPPPPTGKGARLGRFLAQQADVSGPGQISRDVLERYLAELRASIGHIPAHSEVISLTSTFFRAIRQHCWADLAADAVFYPEDYPKQSQRLPRALTGGSPTATSATSTAGPSTCSPTNGGTRSGHA